MFAISARPRVGMHFDWFLRQVGRISSLFGHGRVAWCRSLAAALLLASVSAMPARAGSFNWGSATCITGAVCNTVGSITRFSNAVGGATWVSFHHGGGVGIGYSQHAGQVIVADGTPEAAKRLERVLTTDPGMGVVRHADAGYPEAIEFAKKMGVKMPMLK